MGLIKRKPLLVGNPPAPVSTNPPITPPKQHHFSYQDGIKLAKGIGSGILTVTMGASTLLATPFAAAGGGSVAIPLIPLVDLTLMLTGWEATKTFAKTSKKHFQSIGAGQQTNSPQNSPLPSPQPKSLKNRIAWGIGGTLSATGALTAYAVSGVAFVTLLFLAINIGAPISIAAFAGCIVVVLTGRMATIGLYELMKTCLSRALS